MHEVLDRVHFNVLVTLLIILHLGGFSCYRVASLYAYEIRPVFLKVWRAHVEQNRQCNLDPSPKYTAHTDTRQRFIVSGAAAMLRTKFFNEASKSKN